MKWLTLCLVLLASGARAQELHLMEMETFSVEAWKYDALRDSYLAPLDQDITFGTAMKPDLNLVRWGKYRLFWENRVHMDSTPSHVRHVGWNFRLGAELGPVRVFHEHHSRHVMEATREERFPVFDRYTAEITFYRRTNATE